MNALILQNYMDLELIEMPVPEIGPDEVLVQVKACGICGSDVHGLDGSTGRRIPPVVMGHEASGVVVETGSSVKDLAKGDRITFDSTVYCGQCFYCQRGDINLCDNREVLGVSCGEFRRHGAFAEYVAVPRRIIHRLPDELPFEHAALIEAVSIAVHAVRITPVELGDNAVVVGSGMIGLLTIQALRLAGCSKVIAIDIDDAKLATAGRMGASSTINSRTADAVAEVKRLTNGRGADVAAECVGATEPIQTALACLRKGGSLTLVGNVSPKIELPLQSVVTRQIRVQGSCASSGEYPVCIDLMASRAIQVESLITAVAPLGDGPQWFERLYKHEPNLMKIILRP